ncbi:MAG: tetratricopeptide repeat protein [Ignavibacteriales bacterium]|nr:tetratricopeptide repeat protein [Ignavibacteriales bacterium]
MPNYQTNPLKYILLILFFSLLIISGKNIAFAQEASDSLTVILNQAYDLMQSNPDQAQHLFERAVQIAPNDVSLRRQLGYFYNERNQLEKSLQQFEEAEKIQPSDTIKLQMAFILVSLNREDNAVTVLRELTNSQDENIKKSAEAQLATISSPVAEVLPLSSNWYSRIYAAPFYDTRWETIFYNFDAEQGYFFGTKKMFFSYGFLSLATDGKSKLGEVPEIFSDNAIIGGVGSGVKLLEGLELRAQIGVAYDLVQQDSGAARTRWDFRALAIYGNGIYPNFEFHDNIKVTLDPLLDLYSSIGYYSRYDNAIGYLQARAGARIFEWKYSAIDLYVRSMFIKDANRDFYNNQIDAGIGLRVLPYSGWDLYIMPEYYRAMYLDGVRSIYNDIQEKIGTEKYFGGFRLFIIYDHLF